MIVVVNRIELQIYGVFSDGDEQLKNFFKRFIMISMLLTVNIIWLHSFVYIIENDGLIVFSHKKFC